MVGSGCIIFYDILKPSKTITADCYRQQMIKFYRVVKDKRPQYNGRHDKVTLQHDNAMPHVVKKVKETSQVINWEIWPHPPYSSDIAPSDYYLFQSMHSARLGELFSSCEEVSKWVDQWIAPKESDFFYRGIHLLHEQ